MPKISVYLLHGQLGAGKTTLLTVLLRDPKFTNALIVENEFAGCSVDGDRLSKDHPGVRISEISGSCVCCTGTDALMQKLLELAKKKEDEVPIIIETTGAADAAKLMKSLLLDPSFHEQFELTSNILVIDALSAYHNPKYLNRVQADIVLADHVILTKTDLLAEEDKERIVNETKQQAKDKLTITVHGELPEGFNLNQEKTVAFEGLLTLAGEVDGKTHDAVSWKAMTLPPCSTDGVIEALTQARENGAKILRAKGTFNDSDGTTWRIDATEYVSECVRAKTNEKEPILVLIGENLPANLSV